MNKKTMTGLLVTGLLILGGCSSSKVIDGKSIAASTSLENIDADSLYNKLTETNSDSLMFNFLFRKLCDTKFPITSAMEENADDTVENVKASYQSQYGDDEWEEQFKSALEGSTYGTEENWRNELIRTVQYTEIVKEYVKDNFDKVYDDYYSYASPRMLSLIKISVTDINNPTKEENDKVKEIKALLKEGMSFGDVAKKYSDDDNSKDAKGSLGVIDSNNSLSDTYGSAVATEAMKLKNKQTSDAIKGSDGYYYLYCDTTDKKTIKNELKNVDLYSPLIDYDTYIQYLVYDSYDITYEDEDTKKLVENYVKEQLKAREDERKKK